MNDKHRCTRCGLLIEHHPIPNNGHHHQQCPVDDEFIRDFIRTLVYSDDETQQRTISTILHKTLNPSRLGRSPVRCKRCQLVFYTSVQGNAAKCSWCGHSNWIPVNIEKAIVDISKENEEK